MTRWTENDVPDQHGRTAVVTGANTGIGYQTALVLALHGADVILACRNDAKAAAAAVRIRAAAPHAGISTVHVDLASQKSVREAAARIETDRIDLLVNNAGGVRGPRRTVTEDGFETTFATNHLGPFALTGLLLDRLLPVPGSRIVTVSSIGHRRGVMRFDDLQLATGFRNSTAYFQSKLANLLFTYELQRRLAAAQARTIAVAAHPGNARTEFGGDLGPVVRFALSPGMSWLTWWFLQSREMGALPSLRAATDPGVRGGEYYGPPGRTQFTGHPERVDSSPASLDITAQQRLWAESQALTGVRYQLPDVTVRG
jgi:NAD(P)-dependent dehydrogenase (short-subunit alcohol dehydrogenase family)